MDLSVTGKYISKVVRVTTEPFIHILDKSSKKFYKNVHREDCSRNVLKHGHFWLLKQSLSSLTQRIFYMGDLSLNIFLRVSYYMINYYAKFQLFRDGN